MKESYKLFKQKILRIALFSVGGLLIIISFISIISLFQLSKFDDGLFPFYFLTFIPFIVGIGICFFAPKLPSPSVIIQRLSKEERIIENLKKFQKQHSHRIVFFSVCIFIMLVIFILIAHNGKKVDSMMTPENIGARTSFKDLSPELLNLVSRFYTLLRIRTEQIFQGYWFAALTGFFITLLVFEIAGLGKHDLTLSMWGRIKQLESEVNQLQDQLKINAGEDQ